MALTTNLPPQAYTRETLVKAIDWLSRQPQAVKERANSADLVVSHYLQALRRNNEQMEAPISGETFREDLKNLALDLKQFDEPFAPPPPQTVRRESPVAPEPPEPTPTPPPRAAAKAVTWEVDARSLALAREIQQRLNLSSEADGLRMLITLGSERARELFPNL
jgi:hypothetical protein